MYMYIEIFSEGFYIYTEATLHRANETARIQSPKLTPKPGSVNCLTFWYHMYGDHIGSLNLYVQSGPSLGDAYWTRSGSKGDQWRQAQVTISRSIPFFVSILL